MGSNFVVVALPADDDPIWKVSSEKKPHLTMLILGDAESNPNVDRIALFVQHAVTIAERGPFYLEVEHRDVLGADEADVFKFRKDWSFKWVNQFRNQLLKDNDIRAAYESAEQFPEWQPHITLGYPATPAHEDKIPEHGLHMVRFDRIAVWTGDYEGPDFRLEWPEREFGEDVAWSGMGVDAELERKAAGMYALQHFGTKGMKWGVRKTEAVTGASGRTRMVTPKKAARLDKQWEAKIYSVPGAIAIHNGMADHFNQRIGTLNDKYKDVDFTHTAWDKPSSWTPREQKYMKDIDALTTAGNRAAVKEVHGSSPTGKRRAELSPDGDRILVKEVQVKHAADDSETVAVLKITRNSEGLIIKAEPLMTEPPKEEDPQIQTAIHGEAFAEGLMHFGIKGMKWGVRKPPPAAVSATASSRVPHGDKRKTKIQVEGGQNHPAHEDAIKVAEARIKLKKSGPAALSNQELREVAQRLQLEGQVAVLTSSKGKQFVTQQLQNEGRNLAREGVRAGVKSGVKKSGKTVKKAAATAAVAALI